MAALDMGLSSVAGRDRASGWGADRARRSGRLRQRLRRWCAGVSSAGWCRRTSASSAQPGGVATSPSWGPVGSWRPSPTSSAWRLSLVGSGDDPLSDVRGTSGGGAGGSHVPRTRVVDELAPHDERAAHLGGTLTREGRRLPPACLGRVPDGAAAGSAVTSWRIRKATWCTRSRCPRGSGGRPPVRTGGRSGCGPRGRRCSSEAPLVAVLPRTGSAGADGGDIEAAPRAPARAPVVGRGTAPHEERGQPCASPARDRGAGACRGAAAGDLSADRRPVLPGDRRDHLSVVHPTARAEEVSSGS